MRIVSLQTLGKRFAGRQVLVEVREPGVWMVRTASVAPDNERWVHGSQAACDLREALDWGAHRNRPAEHTRLRYSSAWAMALSNPSGKAVLDTE